MALEIWQRRARCSPKKGTKITTDSNGKYKSPIKAKSTVTPLVPYPNLVELQLTAKIIDKTFHRATAPATRLPDTIQIADYHNV